MPQGFDITGATPGAVQFTFTGLDAGHQALVSLGSESRPALAAALEELGLALEFNIKPLVRVRTGRLRSSIGHFTPDDLTEKATAHDAAMAREAAYYRQPTVNDLAVSVGTRVKYAPYVNYRLGDLFMERGLQATINMIPGIVSQYLLAINGGGAPR